MNREMMAEEIDVIEAAQDYADAIEGGQYGPMGQQVRNAEKALLRAMADLNAQCDGRWKTPD